MQAEIFAFFGGFLILLFIFAEIGDKKILGVFASLLLLIFGIVIGVDNIAFKVGETKIINDNSAEQSTSEVVLDITSTNTTKTITGNETTTFLYASPAAMPYVPLGYAQLFGLCMILLSLYGMYWYGLNVLRQGFGR